MTSPSVVPPAPPASPSRAWARALARSAPMAVLIVALVAFLTAGGADRLSVEALSARHSELQAWAAADGWRAGLLFAAVYAGLAAISLPGALWFTIAGGLIFGWRAGAFYSWLGALGGATLAFLAARLAAREALARFVETRVGPRARALREAIARDGFFYMLAVRLAPAPFFVINLLAAAAPVRATTYIAATGVGLIPASVAYAALGAAAADTLHAGGPVTAADVLRPEIGAAFAGLALVALAPLVLRRAGLAPPR